MALTATLAVQNAPGTTAIVKNTPAHAILSLTNAGTLPITVYAISPWASGVTAAGVPALPAYAQEPCRGCPFVVRGNSTVAVPLNYVIPQAQTFGLGIAAVDLSFSLGATIYSSDMVNGVLSILSDLLMTAPQALVLSAPSQTLSPVAAGR